MPLHIEAVKRTTIQYIKLFYKVFEGFSRFKVDNKGIINFPTSSLPLTKAATIADNNKKGLKIFIAISYKSFFLRAPACSFKVLAN
mmetsp:Transcript_5661/g.511  ORF Transcript_5661/g.511 Transcript_5661/m.511 type:complete len:86 (-) Transcript_5661:340-597(-)